MNKIQDEQVDDGFTLIHQVENGGFNNRLLFWNVPHVNLALSRDNGNKMILSSEQRGWSL